MLWTPYGHWHMQKKADFENRPFCKVLSVSDLKNLEIDIYVGFFSKKKLQEELFRCRFFIE